MHILKAPLKRLRTEASRTNKPNIKNHCTVVDISMRNINCYILYNGKHLFEIEIESF